MLEKLKITPAERKAVALLMCLLFALGLFNSFWQTEYPFGEDYYAGLEEEFNRRTRMLQDREQALMARYFPGRETSDSLSQGSVDTVPGTPASPSSLATLKAEGDTAKVDINVATASELQSLPGIGPVYAGRILAWRRDNGAFASPSDLLNIKGIGKKRLEKLLPFIQLSDSTIKQ